MLRILGLLGLVVASGCFVEPGRGRRDTRYDEGGYYASGALVVQWTVDGSTDPAECNFADAADISILVEERSGGTVGEFVADCRDFETVIELDPGRYWANAVLLDVDGIERTTAVETDTFSVYEGKDFVADIDFPADAFF